MLAEEFNSYILGINPESMRGTRTGVFIGQMYDDTQSFSQKDGVVTGYEVTGANRAMSSNRISFTFNFQGNGQLTSFA